MNLGFMIGTFERAEVDAMQHETVITACAEVGALTCPHFGAGVGVQDS